MSIPRTLTVLAQDIPYEGRVACEFCRFWEEIPAGWVDGSDGICRRMPPISATQWPGTNRETWCGEFLPVVTGPGPADDNLVNLNGRILTIPPGYQMFIQGGRAAITPIPDANVAPPNSPPILKDPGRSARVRLNAVEGEVPTE